MLTKNNIKNINSLSKKKYRDEFRQFIAEGDKIVKELLESNYNIISLYATNEWIEANEKLISPDCTTVIIKQNQLKSISQLTTPNQVLAIVEIKINKTLPDPCEDFILLADRIQDPGNLGSIIRSADWFGFKDIVCSEDCVDLYNPKVIQASMGSFCRLNVNYTDIHAYLSEYKDKAVVYGAFTEGQNVFKCNFRKSGILVIGNESQGISSLTENYITKKVFIPKYNESESFTPDSLNASVAAALLMGVIRMGMVNS